ncbi:MAG: hypothetical protein ACRCZP_13460 [Phycicoccus sp.]
MPGPFPDVAALAVFDRDTAAIRQAATDLGATAVPIADSGHTVVRTWRGVDPHYVAPESPVLVAALDPVLVEAKQAGDRAGEAGRVLGVWADDAEPLVTEGRALADAAAGPVTSRAQEARAMRLTQILVELSLLDERCAKDLAALVPGAPVDTVPQRVRVGETVDRSVVSVTLGYVRLGGNLGLVETRFSDGSVMFTLTNGGTVQGVGRNVPEAPGAPGGAGLEVELAAGVAFENGTSWLVPAGEVDRFRGLLDQYVSRRQIRTSTTTLGGQLGLALTEALNPLPPLPAPTRVVTGFDVPAELKGTLAGGPSGPVDVLASGAAGSTPRWTNAQLPDGSTVSTFGGEASLGGEAGVVVNTRAGGDLIVEGKATEGSNVAVTRDRDGIITRVVLTSTSEGYDGGGGSLGPGFGDENVARARGLERTPTVDITTTSLDVDDTNRAVVEQWLADNEGDPLAGLGQDARLYPEQAAESDPFQNALHSDATVTRVQYENLTERTTLEAGVGRRFDAEAGTETTTGDATGGTYLDRPDIHGNRVERPLPGIPD